MMETIVRHRNEGDATWFLNALVVTKADDTETGGAYYLMEHVFTAASNPPVHIHQDEEEAFYVLEGELEIDVDGVTSVARPGSFVLAPSGLPHAFRVMSDTARVLSISSAPSGNTNGGFPAFLKEVGEPAKALALPQPEAPDPGLLMASAATHALEILPLSGL
jgi:quercetin dioxygenase-like cupin family protein